MKVEAPHDLQGRMIQCEKRARMIGATLVALAHSEVEAPDTDALDALGQVAFELAEEIRAIDQAQVEKDSANDMESHRHGSCAPGTH